MHRWWQTFHMLHLTTNEAAIQQKELPALRAIASGRTAEAGRMFAGIKGNKPCHAAIRQKAWHPISYDVNGGNYKRAMHQN